MKDVLRLACLCGVLMLGSSVRAEEAQPVAKKAVACEVKDQECKANMEKMATQCCKTMGMKDCAKKDCALKDAKCKKLNATCMMKASDCKKDCEKKGADCKQTCEKKGADCKQTCEKKGADCKQACEKKGADCKQACEKHSVACEKSVRPAHCPMGRWVFDLSSLSKVKNPERKPRKAIELTLGKDGKIHGFSGVNRFFGNVSLKKDGSISLDGMGSTRMMGIAMGYEDAFMQAMAKVKFFQVHCGRLLLKDADKNVILQFTR